MIALRRVTDENIWKIIKLTVREEQKEFVATNTQSILQAYTTIIEGQTALPFGIYDGDKPVGFIMFGYGTLGDEDEPAIAAGNYCIWRLMIDQEEQGKGYGREAMRAALDFVRSWPCGPAEYCWLSYEPQNVGAKALYNAMGFVENGQSCGEEVVAALKL